jgi:hypothetical protein
MKNILYKTALVAALGLGGSIVAHAASGDLVLGFTSQTSGSDSDDYVVDLGALPTLGNVPADYNTALNVSGFNWSAFTATGVPGAAGVTSGDISVGLVAGVSTGANSGKYVIGGLLDTGGSPTAAGSTAPQSGTENQISKGAADANSVTLGSPATSSSGSWSSLIALNPTTPGTLSSTTAGDYADQLGFEPMATLSSDSIVLDLWKQTYSNTSSFTFDGTVTLAFNTVTDTMTATYDEVAVPEPTTYGILGGMGVLLLGLRRQLTGKLA